MQELSQELLSEVGGGYSLVEYAVAWELMQLDISVSFAQGFIAAF